MSRRFGIDPAVTAQEMAQHVEASGEGFAALPTPPGAAPYRFPLSKVLPKLAAGSRVLQVIGDSGGVKDPKPQAHVAAAQAADAIANGVEFVHHVGDVDYFTGEEAEYVPQFFEAYVNLNLPIFPIPGNHDGAGQDQLASFMRYFCDQQGPRLLPEVAEYHRDTLELPNCYYTLEDDLFTLIGLYSNVPSGGEIQADQEAWLVEELKAAPPARALIVSLHHPPISCDAHHGGSQKMATLLDRCFTAAGRYPDLVLSGHVHDYQRFTRTVNNPAPPGGAYQKKITYVVCGAGGYHNLHGMAANAAPGLQVTPDTTLDAFEAKAWGFLRLTITPPADGFGRIAGEYVTVDHEGKAASADKFEIAAGV